jgi:uncharacterized protein YggL (DUF469 family)
MKNKKKNSKDFVELENNNLPDVVDMDSLSYYDDDHLDKYHNHLQVEREKALRAGSEVTAWEVEICYAQREMKIRNSRRSAHEKYVRMNPDLFQDANFSYE